MEKFYWDTIRNARYTPDDSYNRSYDSSRDYPTYDVNLEEDLEWENPHDYFD